MQQQLFFGGTGADHQAAKVAKGKAKTGSQAAASLPRNSQSNNNKKNMQRRKEEKQRRAEKRDKAIEKGVVEERKKDPNDPNNHMVHSYRYLEAGPRDSLHATAQRGKPGLLDSYKQTVSNVSR